LPGLDSRVVETYRREEVNDVFYYDSDFHRQRQKERMAEMRDEYRRVQAHSESRARSRMRRYAEAARSHMRFHPRRAPVYRA
jgi:hypothetical protein